MERPAPIRSSWVAQRDWSHHIAEPDAKEPVMSNVRLIGLDVHAETIAVAVAEADGDVRAVGVIPNRLESIKQLVKKLGPVLRRTTCDRLRTRPGITVPLWTPMHPAGLRCSSLSYTRYARSSRLAGRAPRRPEWRTYSRTNPKVTDVTASRRCRCDSARVGERKDTLERDPTRSAQRVGVMSTDENDRRLASIHAASRWRSRAHRRGSVEARSRCSVGSRARSYSSSVPSRRSTMYFH